jgi:hypothetical protein
VVILGLSLQGRVPASAMSKTTMDASTLRKILEAQVQAIQEKIGDRSLVGALDHPSNDAIHLVASFAPYH